MSRLALYFPDPLPVALDDGPVSIDRRKVLDEGWAQKLLEALEG